VIGEQQGYAIKITNGRYERQKLGNMR
jgi:hypothetical protein